MRDICLACACEEAEMDYRLRSVPMEDRGAEHLARRACKQVAFLTEGSLSMLKSGACLIHLTEKSVALLPRDDAGQPQLRN